MEKLKRKQLQDFQNKRRQISILARQKEQIEAENHSIEGMPRSGKISDPVGNLSAAVIDIDTKLALAYKDYLKARAEVYRWIALNVPTENQSIIEMRLIDRTSYREIGRKLGKHHLTIRDWVLRYIDQKAKPMV